MASKRLILDGLWQCLCPSFHINTLVHRSITIAAHRYPRQPSLSTAFASSRRISPPKCRRSYFTRIPRGPNGQTEDRTNLRRPSTPFQANGAFSHLDEAQERDEQQHDNEDKDSGSDSLTWRTPGVPVFLETQSTQMLEAKLRQLASLRPNVQNAMQILRILIRDRHLYPQAWHYKALIQCNADPRRGSPQIIRRLLTEMESNGIPADSGTLHTALQAIAVHPDHLLRQDITRILRDRWLTLSPDGWHYVVAGLIREHQFELALDHIAHMERKDITVEGWLHSLLIYYLCEFQEFEQIIELMRSRVSQGHDVTLDLWMHVLDAASTALHHDTTCFVWERMVELGYLYPPHELCHKVLSVASEVGDPRLAASVVRFLSQNNIALAAEDYGKVCETHLVAGNLYAAFEALCEMHLAGIPLEPSSTDPIITHATRRKSHLREAWAVLKQLKAAGHGIPLGCAKVVLEICERGALHDPFEVDDGVAFYKELYTLCDEKPDTSLYNTLISICRKGRNTESGMFVVKEMAASGAIPDATTFGYLILMCLESGNFESAYKYFHDLLERGLHPSEDARVEIRELCSHSSDEFAVQLRFHPEISEGLVRSLEDAIEAQEGKPLFQKVSSASKKGKHDVSEYVRWKNARREEENSKHQMRSTEARRLYNKERRKRKRRMLAISRTREEDGWMDYKPGGLHPEDQSSLDIKASVS